MRIDIDKVYTQNTREHIIYIYYVRIYNNIHIHNIGAMSTEKIKKTTN